MKNDHGPLTTSLKPQFNHGWTPMDTDTMPLPKPGGSPGRRCILTRFLTSVQARRLRYFGGGFAANVARASRLFGLAGMLAGIRNLRTMSRCTPGQVKDKPVSKSVFIRVHPVVLLPLFHRVHPWLTTVLSNANCGNQVEMGKAETEI